jgi:hypothetical protein
MPMELFEFQNSGGEGLVAFEPWRTSGPEYEKDTSRWYCHITIGGKRVFEYGCPCGTCGIVFRRVGTPEDRLSDNEAVRMLGNLDAIPAVSTLQRFAKVLEPGSYIAAILSGVVRLIEPGAPDDYFATEVVRLSGLEPPDYLDPSGPRTSYYQLGSNVGMEKRTGRTTSPHRALAASVVMPLHLPSQLHREHIDYWKREAEEGKPLTALALSVIDNQQPATAPKDPEYEYEEHFLLTNCLLDGHHRIQAASELGIPVRILSLVAKNFCLVNRDNDIKLILSLFAKLSEIQGHAYSKWILRNLLALDLPGPLCLYLWTYGHSAGGGGVRRAVAGNPAQGPPPPGEARPGGRARRGAQRRARHSA